jgi:hypothetical protein
LDLEKVPWSERSKKMRFKEFFLENTACIVCSEQDRRKCDSKKKLRNTLLVLCAVRKWLWNAGR